MGNEPKFSRDSASTFARNEHGGLFFAFFGYKMRISTNGAFQDATRADGFVVREFSGLPELRSIVSKDWTPAVFVSGYRSQATFASCDWLFADIDDGCTIAKFKADFAGFEYYLLTSRNHQKEKKGVTCDRFHVLFPVPTYRAPAVLREDLRSLASSRPYFDKNAATPERFFFGVENCQVEHVEGRPYTADKTAERAVTIDSRAKEKQITGKKEPEPSAGISGAISSRITLQSVSGFETYSQAALPEREIDRASLMDALKQAAKKGAFDEYQEWINAGLALKTEAFTIEDWKALSHSGIPEETIAKHWDSFPETSARTLGSLVKITQDKKIPVQYKRAESSQAIRLEASGDGGELPDNSEKDASPRFSLDDIGNAGRFVYGAENLRFLYASNVWASYDEKTGRWKRDDAKVAVMAKAREVVGKITQEGELAEDDGEMSAIIAHAAKSRSLKSLKAMLELAATDERVAMNESAFDANLNEFAAGNGIIDLQTGSIRAAKREDYVMRGSNVEYDPKAECPEFLRFLETIFLGKKDLLDFMQVYLGYLLTGRTDSHVFGFFYGTGKNGKSTLIDILRHVMGDYYTTIRPETLLEKDRQDSIRSDLAALVGVRVAVASESDAGAKLSPALIKEVTGGDMISCRHLYGKIFSYKPSWKPILISNHEPDIKAADPGTWRRIKQIPFDYAVPDGEENRTLAEQILETEASGVLAWLVRGSVRYYAHGLPVSIEVEAATADYREGEDNLKRFMDDCIAIDKDATITSTELLEIYNEWASRKNEFPYKAKTLSKMMKERGFERIHARDGTRFRGIRKKTEIDRLKEEDAAKRQLDKKIEDEKRDTSDPVPF